MANRYTYEHSNNLNSAKISFISGLQSAINALIASGDAVEGTFYLTTDTHRLYIGRTITADGDTILGSSKTIPIPINEGILSVANLAALNATDANAGEFYYLTDSNILAVYNGTLWVLINPDTNTWENTKVTNFSIGTGVANTATGAIVYPWTLTQRIYDESGSELASNLLPSDITGTFAVSAESLASSISVGIDHSLISGSSNETILSLTGRAADSSNTVTVSGGNGITLSSTSAGFSIAGKTYDLASPAVSGANNTNVANITLSDESDNKDTINIKTGVNLNIDNSVANEITIKHTTPTAATSTYQITPDKSIISGKTYYYKDANDDYLVVTSPSAENLDSYYEIVSTYGNNTGGTVNIGDTLRIPKIRKDANGHIVAIEDVGIVLPTAVTIESASADNQGKVVLTDSNNNTISSTTAVLYFTITKDGTTETILNQGNLGSFYTAATVDSRITAALRGLNALVYKGTIGSDQATILGSTLPTSQVSVGDTYLVDLKADYTTGTNTTKSANVGDLFIATGTEDSSTGYIASNLEWTYVAAGNIDTTYTLSTGTGNNPSVSLNDNNGTASGSFLVIGGTAITVSGSINNGSKITINHSNSNVTTGVYGTTAATTLNHSGTFLIPSITVDQLGHITSATNIGLTLPADNNTTYLLTNEDSGTSGAYSNTIYLLDNNTGRTSISINGGTNLGVTAAQGTITLYHENSGVTATSYGNATDVQDSSSFKVPYLTVDARGHITSAVDRTVTLPSAKTYSLVNSVTNNIVTSLLKDSNNTTTGTLGFSSSSLNIEATSTTDVYSIDLVWGSI